MKTYEALERAGLALLSDVSNATVEVVGTRWGPQMEELTQHGMRPPTAALPDADVAVRAWGDHRPEHSGHSHA